MNCPKCYRPLQPDAAQCHYSDCHFFFDRAALIWLQRDKIQERAREQARLAKLEEEEKERKKAAAAAATAARPAVPAPAKAPGGNGTAAAPDPTPKAKDSQAADQKPAAAPGPAARSDAKPAV